MRMSSRGMVSSELCILAGLIGRCMAAMLRTGRKIGPDRLEERSWHEIRGKKACLHELAFDMPGMARTPEAKVETLASNSHQAAAQRPLW